MAPSHKSARKKVIFRVGDKTYNVEPGLDRNHYAKLAEVSSKAMVKPYNDSLALSIKVEELRHQVRLARLKKAFFQSIFKSTKTLFNITKTPTAMLKTSMESHERQYVAACILEMHAKLSYETEKQKLKTLERNISENEKVFDGTLQSCVVGWVAECVAGQIGEENTPSDA